MAYIYCGLNTLHMVYLEDLLLKPFCSAFPESTPSNLQPPTFQGLLPSSLMTSTAWTFPRNAEEVLHI